MFVINELVYIFSVESECDTNTELKLICPKTIETTDPTLKTYASVQYHHNKSMQHPICVFNMQHGIPSSTVLRAFHLKKANAQTGHLYLIEG